MKPAHVWMGVLICAMFTTAIVALFLIEPKAGAKEPLLLLIGSLSAAFGAVVAWFFGSTSSSARKDELLAASTPAPAGITTVQTATITETETKP